MLKGVGKTILVLSGVEVEGPGWCPHGCQSAPFLKDWHKHPNVHPYYPEHICCVEFVRFNAKIFLMCP